MCSPYLYGDGVVLAAAANNESPLLVPGRACGMGAGDMVGGNCGRAGASARLGLDDANPCRPCKPCTPPAHPSAETVAAWTNHGRNSTRNPRNAPAVG